VRIRNLPWSSPASSAADCRRRERAAAVRGSHSAGDAHGVFVPRERRVRCLASPEGHDPQIDAWSRPITSCTPECIPSESADTMYSVTAATNLPLSLYREIDRADWARLSAGLDQPLSETEIVGICGIGDRLNLDEVREVYMPLSRLLS